MHPPPLLPPAITPRSPAHGALIARAIHAFEHEDNPERRRMLEHMLRNTLRYHCKAGCAKQTTKLSEMIDGITTGTWSTFKEFSAKALGPYIVEFHPTQGAPKMTTAQFLARRQAEEELRKGHIAQLAGKARGNRPIRHALL